jgi:chromate transporter
VTPISPADPVQQTTLAELARVFLRLGATAFGGPAAHIAMMREQVVVRRKWLTEERFLDLLGATNLIPGPNSTELAIHIGWERRGWPGLLVAGLCFIVPAMLITAACGWAYLEYGALPEVGWLFYGIKPVIIAIVAQAIYGLAPKAARTTPLRLAAAVVFVLALAGLDELLLLFAAGALLAIVGSRSPPSAAVSTAPETNTEKNAETNTAKSDAAASNDGDARATARQWLPFGLGSAALAGGSVTLPALFWVFLKTGAVLFGSGYVLIAFLRADLVEQYGWLTEEQLLDAIAVGQMTPGPVFTTATFIGYVLAGPAGALVATAGIFLPAFAFVAMSAPILPRLRASRITSAFLDGVNVASLALMAAVTVEIGRAALVDLWTVLLAAAAVVLLVRFRVGAMWVIALGAVVGAAVHL